MNSVVIVGRLVRDPELKFTGDGKAVAQMRVAVDRAGDQQEDGKYGAGFFDVSVFGRDAENCAQYLFKGSQAGFSGALRFHEWEAKDGSGKRSKVEITAFQVQFLGSKRDGDGGEREAAEVATDVGSVDGDDDIPF